MITKIAKAIIQKTFSKLSGPKVQASEEEQARLNAQALSAL